jgi:ubiquinone/menaquinone biosynthesis C-methylase UbiE
MKQLKDFFINIPVSTILDAGTGSGDFIEVLKDVFPLAQITGIDPNTESLMEAARKFPDFLLAEMSAEKLEFDDNTFDLVSISMALHHLPNVQTALKELQRVVKPNGWIIVNELFSDNLNPAQEVHKMYHHIRSKIDRLTGESHNETFKRAEILEMIKQSGIRVMFDFNHDTGAGINLSIEELELRVEKIMQNLEKIKNLPEYDGIKIEIDQFYDRVLKYGFQPATRVVLAGQPGK